MKPFPIIDKSSWFYKNCKRQRKSEAKICQCCPFRSGIEEQENPPKRDCPSKDSPDGKHHPISCSPDPNQGFCCAYCGIEMELNFYD